MWVLKVSVQGKRHNFLLCKANNVTNVRASKEGDDNYCELLDSMQWQDGAKGLGKKEKRDKWKILKTM